MTKRRGPAKSPDSDKSPLESEQLQLDTKPERSGPSDATEPNKRLLADDWNQTVGESFHKKRIHDFIEEQVERSPDVIAAVFRDQEFTYRELDS